MINRLTVINQKLSPGLRKILGNVRWLFTECILTMIVAFFVGIWVIRYLGSENFGKLSYTNSFVALFSAIAQLGLNAIVIRNIVHEEKAAPEILGTAFVLKLMASSVTIVLIGIAIWTFDTNPDVRWMTLIIAFSLVFSAFDAIEFWFESQVLPGVLAILRSVQLILSSLLKISFIALKLPLMAFVWLLLAEQAVKVLGEDRPSHAW